MAALPSLTDPQEGAQFSVRTAAAPPAREGRAERTNLLWPPFRNSALPRAGNHNSSARGGSNCVLLVAERWTGCGGAADGGGGR